jgi:hypothetical protein
MSHRPELESDLKKNKQESAILLMKYPFTYNYYVEKALDTMREGSQYLSYIDPLFRTKKVCLAAVMYELKNPTKRFVGESIRDMPASHIDYVMQSIRELKTATDLDLKLLEMECRLLKEKEQKSGYYGKFKNLQELLDHWGAIDYDDMLLKKFNKVSEERQEIDDSHEVHIIDCGEVNPNLEKILNDWAATHVTEQI